MPHKLRKTRKNRGTRTQGYGRIGQHRKSGSQGFRKPGRHKHLWSYVVTHEPDYFGKHGFTSPKSLKNKPNPINIKNLDALAAQISAEAEGKTHITPRRRQNRKTLNHNRNLLLKNSKRKNNQSRRKSHNRSSRIWRVKVSKWPEDSSTSSNP